MGENSTRIRIGAGDLGSSEFEMNATIFRGKVCVEFKCDGSDTQKELAEKLRRTLHEDADPSILERGGVHTMNTRFNGIPDMLEFLRGLGFSCRETVGQFPPGVQRIRFMGDNK